jgi:hypothetical protein
MGDYGFSFFETADEDLVMAPEGVSCLSLVRVLDKMSETAEQRLMMWDVLAPMVCEIDDDDNIQNIYDLDNSDCETIQSLVKKLCMNPGMMRYQRFGVVAPGKGYNPDTGEELCVFICMYSDGPNSIEATVWDNVNRVLLMKPYKVERNSGTMSDALLLLSNKLAFDLSTKSANTEEMEDKVRSVLEAGFAMLDGKDS